MMRIGVRELEEHLSAILARVEGGEAITVTRRDREVAVLVPPAGGDETEVLRRLAGTGKFSWSGGKPAGSRKPPRVGGRSVSDAVLDDRR